MRLNSDAFGSCIEVVKQQWFMVMVDRKKNCSFKKYFVLEQNSQQN